MARDLRKMFQEYKEEKHLMKSGHKERFLNRLEEEIPRKKRHFLNWKIAASIVLILSSGVYFFNTKDSVDPINNAIVEKDTSPNNTNTITLSKLSPDLKTVEEYYVTNIGLVLSELEISDSNKALVDSFMERLSELNTEYETLNKELNQVGPNDQTINALINNLQLRLQLLEKLKIKLNELKSSRNETVTTNTI
ncbi:MAG: hypothetical protein V3U92_19050 [Cellulophaga sp.]